jgi:putative salt-induced outer membrane protein
MTCVRAAALAVALLSAVPAHAAHHRAPAKKAEAEPPIVWLAPPAPPPEPIVVIWAPPPQVGDVPPLPPEARDLIEKAIASGDQSQVKAVVSLARETYPQGAQQIDALAAENDARAAEKAAQEARARADRLAEASFLDLWKGQIEVGGSRSTGNTDTLALYGSLTLDREGLKWRQHLAARADYQKTDGTTSVEKITAQWQPQYKLDNRLYAYGLAQYDHDRFLGIDDRYTLGVGAGYGIVRQAKLRIDLEGGPAVRHTDFVDVPAAEISSDEPHMNTLAARASLAFDWKPSASIEFQHHTALFVEAGDSSLVATTSLDSQLFGPLKARFSYDVNYESNPVGEAKTLDTISRAALVYSF